MIMMDSEVHISWREWAGILAWSAVILLLTSLPYLYGAALSTPANQFGGFVIGVEDGNSYLAKMRLGATDSWRFHVFYTSEPHESGYLFLFHLLLGKIAHLTGLSFIRHSVETAYVEKKQALLTQFFAPDNDDFRRQLLHDYGITYLFYGPAERNLGGFNPARASYLRQVYNNGSVQIYRVTE